MSSKKAVGNDWLILDASLADVFLPLSAHFTIDFHMVFLFIYIYIYIFFFEISEALYQSQNTLYMPPMYFPNSNSDFKSLFGHI